MWAFRDRNIMNSITIHVREFYCTLSVTLYASAAIFHRVNGGIIQDAAGLIYHYTPNSTKTGDEFLKILPLLIPAACSGLTIWSGSEGGLSPTTPGACLTTIAVWCGKAPLVLPS